MGTDAAKPARMLGRYALYEKIASGGMASVHLGRLVGPVGFARTVAIKRMHAQFAEDPEFVSMFLDEARLAGRIRHPNVVPTLDVVAMSGELFLVMEFVHGESLSRLIKIAASRGERIPAPMVATIMAGVLHGLHAAHEATSDRGEQLEVVHRDVSPHNILVGVDGVARVLDFGVAKAVGRLQTTREGQLKGKLAYMAPEQLKGVVTRGSDIYASAVVLWEALTGKRLFGGENEVEVFAKVLAGCKDPPSRVAPEIPVALDAVTMRGLLADPAARFATAREMACALEDALPLAPASRIGAWVERAAKDTLEQRNARLADIESDSIHYVVPDVRAGEATEVAVTPLDASRGPTGVAAAGSFGSSLESGKQLGPFGSEETSHTQLSSGSVSSPGRRSLFAARPRRTWMLAAGGVVLLGGAALLGRVTTSPSADASPTLASSSPPEPASTPSPPPEPSAAPVPAAVASTPPTVQAPHRPPALAPPATALAPAVHVAPAPLAQPKGPAPAAAVNCDPPYTINALGHRVRKPNCF